LPPVTFYKPNGPVNQHNGYANVTDGDKHIAAVVAALQNSPQWAHMLIVITYDEFGGLWDHVAPPKADTFGPGTRIPAIIISPYAKKGYVDHTQYDTTPFNGGLPGIAARDALLQANGYPAMGDLTNALALP
jgi:phospholipase C